MLCVDQVALTRVGLFSITIVIQAVFVAVDHSSMHEVVVMRTKPVKEDL